MNTKNADTILIMQERMAGWLMFNRFHKVDEKPDLKDSNRNVYIFKDTKELRECMSRFTDFKTLV